MMKRLLAILMVFVLLLAGCQSGGGSASGEKETIKIGHVANLSGASTHWGVAEQNAINMEIEKVNAAGGVLGRQLELISYDMKNDPLEAVNATRRLISDGVVAIIGPPASGAGIAMAPITDEANVGFIATVSTNPKVTVNDELGGVVKSAFRVCFIDPFQGTVAARFALDELDAKTYAIIYDIGSDYSQGLEEYFREEMDKNGATMLAREGFRTSEVDFRAILGKVKDVNPDVIYAPADISLISMIVKQAGDLGITNTIVSGDAASTPEMINLAGPASEGVYMTSLTDINDPKLADWIAEYKGKYDIDPVLPNPVMAADAARMLIAAIERAGEADSQKVMEELAKTTDLSVLSGTLTIDPETHNPINKPAVVQVVKDGEITFVKLVEDF